LRQEVEQMRYLLQIKLPRLTQRQGFNQFKLTGANLNGTLGIGTEDI
jgi:hypothetical protein